MRHAFRYLILFAFIKTLPLSPLLAAEGSAASDERKATILSLLQRDVKWRSQPKGEKFVYGVFGDKAVQEKLQAKLAGVRFQNLPVEGRNVENIEQAIACQVLFIPLKRNADWRVINGGEVRPGVLTVGESLDFIDKGGVIRIGPMTAPTIEVHLANAKTAQLQLPFSLVQVAKRKLKEH